MTKDAILGMLRTERNVARSTQITVRLTEAERFRITKAANKHKVKPAALMRTFILAGLEDLEA